MKLDDCEPCKKKLECKCCNEILMCPLCRMDFNSKLILEHPEAFNHCSTCHVITHEDCKRWKWKLCYEQLD